MLRTLDSIAARSEGLWLLLGRIFLGVLFAPSGYGKLTNPGGLAGMLTAKGAPAPEALAMLGGAVEMLGGLAIIVGFKTRAASLLMIIFVIVATLLAHQYWMLDDPARMAQRIQFFKNLAIIGGFLFVFVRGAGPISFDRR
jgi:putative oxidoreductase